MINLEPLCARYGHAMITGEGCPQTSLTDKENVITKALGVLAENGLYAMCVFLLSCNKKECKEYGKFVLVRQLRELWREQGVDILPKDASEDPNRLLSQIIQITENLPRTILARKIAEQALIFGRYHAKALNGANQQEG